MSFYYHKHKKQLVFLGIFFIVTVLLVTVVFLRQRQQIVQYAAGDTITVIAAGDFQATGNSMLKTTSDLALNQNADYVLAIGDISDSGTLSSYQSSFTPTWGRMMSITYPAPGNHDLYPGNINQYLQYFNSRYNGSQTYYSINWGAWHIISLDSNHPSSSTQLAWLRQDLAANPNKPILAFWHIPRWSTDNTHGNTSSMKSLWDPLYEAHADVIVNGHVHVYQRYAPMDGSGNLQSDGIREFTAGIAGNKTRSCPRSDSHLEFRSCGSSGFIKFTLTPTNYSWEYMRSDGSIVDSGSAPVHASVASTATATPPTQTTVTPTSTPVPGQSSTRFSLKVLLHGLGNAGDNANPNSSGNFDVQHPQRTVTLEFYDTNNQLAATKQGTITLNPQTGVFTGTIDGSSIQTGSYRIRVAVDKYLARYIDGIQTITEGTNNELPEVSLIAGDVTNDNIINIIDYNNIIDCFSDILPANACNETQVQQNDINDDGVVNQFDYNLFLRELTNLSGESGVTGTPIPQATTTPTPTLTPTTTPTQTPPPSGSKLSWAPPTLNNPTTINLSNSNHSLKLDANRDYLLVMPTTVLNVGSSNLSINGGHNVVLIGGEMTGNGVNGSIRATNQSGTLHIEGLYISGGSNLQEGLQFQNEDNATVQLENIRFDTVHGSKNGHHADLVQTWGGGPKNFRVDRLTGSTTYQGFMLQNGGNQEWDFRNINIMHFGSEGWTMYDGNPHASAINMMNVYFGGSTDGIYTLGHGKDDKEGFYLGTPPNGDFVSAGSAGIGYQTPGYN